MFSQFLRQATIIGSVALAACGFGVAFAEESRLMIGQFSTGSLEDWQKKSFSGETSYAIETVSGVKALQAISDRSASGLYRKRRVDLTRTPYLNWSWRVDKPLDKIDEQSKSGDDYAARVYVVIDGGWAFWRTRAVNYVWASNSPKGKIWPNAFAGDHAMMLALRSADDAKSLWFHEKRNIFEDLRQLLGEPITAIDAVAIMTDTDNAGGRAIAYYGDIYFTTD
ncbi:MAG: DUF3047 domain-containing protein [Methylomicrobium sp.]